MTFKKQSVESESLVEIFKTKNGTKKELVVCVQQLWQQIASMFTEVAKLAPLEAIRDENQRTNFIVNDHA